MRKQRVKCEREDKCSIIGMDGPRAGPRQPRRRNGNPRAAYLCPVCRENAGELEEHLLECFSTFLDDAKEQTLTPPLPTLTGVFHPVFPMFLPPPPIPGIAPLQEEEEEVDRQLSLDLKTVRVSYPPLITVTLIGGVALSSTGSLYS